MRLKHTLAISLLLSLPFAATHSRLEADGLLKRHHHHHHSDDHADKSTTVRLPAQNVRIETTSPRVIVGESHHHRRVRGLLSAGPAFMPLASGPMVATFLPMTTTTTTQTSVGSSAMDALHAAERQHLEFARHKAALTAEIAHVEKAMVRVASGFSTTVTTSDDVKASLDALTKRISDVERLLLIHDNVLKENFPKKN